MIKYVINMNLIDKIKNKINEIRTFIINDGGDIEFVSFNNGIVYIKMSGTCKKCPFVNETITNHIEKILIKEIKEIKKVKNIS